MKRQLIALLLFTVMAALCFRRASYDNSTENRCKAFDYAHTSGTDERTGSNQARSLYGEADVQRRKRNTR